MQVLGARLSLAPVLRLAHKDDPPLPTEPEPRAEHEETPPPLRHTLHGHVYHQQGGESVAGTPFVRPGWVNNNSLEGHAKELASAALAQGKHLQGSGLAYSRVPGRDSHYTMLADPLGNVTVRSAEADWQQNPAIGTVNRRSFNDHIARVATGGDVRQHNREDPPEELLELHKRALEEGKPYLTSHTASRHIIPMLQTVHERNKDSAPALIMADHLDELGNSHLAERIRTYNHIHGAPQATEREERHGSAAGSLYQWLTQPEDVHRQWNELPENASKVQFAHMTGYKPRRHEYLPKPRATDLKEFEWGKIRHYFPEPEMGPKNRRTPIKVMINATLFRLQNQIPLRELEQVAPDFPPWGSVHSAEFRIAEAGLWPTILTEIGRSHLLPIAEKMIHGIVKAGAPDTSAKINTEGMQVQQP